MSSELSNKSEDLSAWKTENVAEWLINIGLEKYVNKFKRYNVTGLVLFQLDEALLDDLCVTNSSDRETLLEAVSHFTSSIEDCLKNSSKEQTDSARDPEEKAASFSGFPELLPTIGEEEELEGENNERSAASERLPSEDPGESNQSNKQLPQQERSSQCNQDDKEPNNSKTERISMTDEMSSCSDEPSSPTLKDESDVASRATQIVQVISEENMCLRKQLDKCCQEIRRLQNVEKELRTTQIMYKDLKGAFISREHKEKAMRLRLEAEITQLQKNNAELTEKVRESESLDEMRSSENIETLTEVINKRDKEIKELQKEREAAKTSLQNLERLMKRKSTEIINLQQQLASNPKIESKQQKERKSSKTDDATKQASFHGLGEIWQQTFMRGERLRGKNSQKSRSHSSEYNVSTCVPVLVDLLKEKDGEISNLRKEINKIKPTGEAKENNWSFDRPDNMHLLPQGMNANNEIYDKYYKDDQRRYSDLETTIKSLHVQLAEKDAMVNILQCKYGVHQVDCQHSTPSSISTPIRTPSFTSQVSSISSHEDSGIMTPSDCPNGGMLHKDKEAEQYQVNEEKFEEENDQPSLAQQENNEMNDHCWFV